MPSKIKKTDKCVEKVKKTGRSKAEAEAICKSKKVRAKKGTPKKSK